MDVSDQRPGGVVTGSAPEAAPHLTRAQRRAERSRAAGGVPESAKHPQVWTFGSGLVVALLLIWAAHADASVVAASVALLGVVLALGWPVLWDLPHALSPVVAIAAAGLGCALAVSLASGPAWLDAVPVAVAVAVLVMFVQQLLRRDGREGLVTSLAVTAFGIAVVVLGMSWSPLSHTEVGVEVLTVSLGAAAVSGIADLLVGLRRVRPWMLPISVVVGGLAAVVINALHSELAVLHAIELGFVCGVIAHSVRRVLATCSGSGKRRGQVTIAIASMLSVGMAAWVVARLLQLAGF